MCLQLYLHTTFALKQKSSFVFYSLSLPGFFSAWTARHCLEDRGCTTQIFLINLKKQTNLFIYLFKKVLKSSSFNQQQRGLILHTCDAYIIQIYYFHNKRASLAISESKCCFSSQKAHKHWGTTEILYFKSNKMTSVALFPSVTTRCNVQASMEKEALMQLEFCSKLAS